MPECVRTPTEEEFLFFQSKDWGKMISLCSGTKALYLSGKRKGKGHPITAHEGPDGEWSYSCTLFLTSALDGGWVVNVTPRPLYLRERSGTHCIGDWVGPRAGLDGCGKSRPPNGTRSPGRPVRRCAVIFFSLSFQVEFSQFYYHACFFSCNWLYRDE